MAGAAAAVVFAFLPASSFAAGAALRLGPAAGFLASGFDFAGVFGFSSGALAGASGFVFATLGDTDFFGFAAAAAFLMGVFVFALVAAVDVFVASRGERRVGAAEAFFGGII